MGEHNVSGLETIRERYSGDYCEACRFGQVNQHLGDALMSLIETAFAAAESMVPETISGVKARGTYSSRSGDDVDAQPPFA
jgi:hypothetical protein